jgi:ATP-dependent Lon protease
MCTELFSATKPLHQPMQKATYAKKVQNLKGHHSWLDNCHIEPAPGHLKLIAELFKQIEIILPSSNRQKFRFFRVSHSFGGLLIYSTNINTHHERLRALRNCIEKGLDRAERTCPTCGLRQSEGIDEPRFSQFRCDEHRTGNGLFLEDFAPPITPSRNLEELKQELYPEGLCTSGIKEAIELVKAEVSTNDNAAKLAPPSQEDTAVEAVPTKVEVHLFELAAFDRFNRNISSRNKDHQYRLRLATEKIGKAGLNKRELQTLPNDWQEILLEFSARFPNFANVSELLNDHFALTSLGDRRITFPALLLTGDPGIGKTEAARWLAEKFQLPFRVQDMANAQTNAAISGSDSSFSNAEEGVIFELLSYQPIANPILLLDEIDKVDQHLKFNPLAPLYSLLEPSSAKQFVDLAIKDIPIDASYINWIATANDIHHLPQPILSRFIVLNIPSPTPEQTQVISQNIYAKLLNESSWGSHFFTQLSGDVKKILENKSPRNIRVLLTRALGSAARAKRREINIKDISIEQTQSAQGIGFLANFH